MNTNTLLTVIALVTTIYLTVTVLMHAMNAWDMRDARRAWWLIRGEFYSLPSGSGISEAADDLLEAVDAYEDTLYAFQNIWKWPWLLLLMVVRPSGIGVGGGRMSKDRALMDHDIAACALVTEE